jgi:hypothetical protein
MVVLVCGVSYGQQEPGPGFQHLKCLRPKLGDWRYEGPLLEDVPDFAEKGARLVVQVSRRWALNKSAIEENMSIEVEGGIRFLGKSLIGWNAAEEQIVYGGMNSLGGIGLGAVSPNEKAKTFTFTSEGVDGEGEEVSAKQVLTQTGEDTLTYQALERHGGPVEGPSPVYTFKRVKRAKQPKRLKQAK